MDARWYQVESMLAVQLLLAKAQSQVAPEGVNQVHNSSVGLYSLSRAVRE